MHLSDMVSHLRYRQLLDAHVDHELTGVAAGRVSQHVDTCRRCGDDADLTVIVKAHLAVHRFLPPRRSRDGRTIDE